MMFLEFGPGGLYLGRNEFSEECMKRAKKEGHREKPQVRLLLSDRGIRPLALTMLERLGEKHPGSTLNPCRRPRSNRHFAIYSYITLGVHRNEEIGKVFGVGYTAVIGAVKRGQAYINSDRQVENRVRKILNDI